MGGIVTKFGNSAIKSDVEEKRLDNADKTNEKVVYMLAKKKGEVDKTGHTMTFEK